MLTRFRVQASWMINVVHCMLLHLSLPCSDPVAAVIRKQRFQCYPSLWGPQIACVWAFAVLTNFAVLFPAGRIWRRGADRCSSAYSSGCHCWRSWSGSRGNCYDDSKAARLVQCHAARPQQEAAACRELACKGQEAEATLVLSHFVGSAFFVRWGLQVKSQALIVSLTCYKFISSSTMFYLLNTLINDYVRNCFGLEMRLKCSREVLALCGTTQMTVKRHGSLVKSIVSFLHRCACKGRNGSTVTVEPVAA